MKLVEPRHPAAFDNNSIAGQSYNQLEAPICVDRVTKEYLGGRRTALDAVSVDINANQVTALIGPSGCGKTTLLRLIAGLEYPTYGDVKMHGKSIRGPGPERGMVFQAYTSFPWLTVAENVARGMKIQGVPKKEQQERAEHFLRLVHLEEFARSYPIELSGGMKQRVAIARALAQNPEVLLLDEPFGALDAQVTWEMEEMVVEIIEREAKTIILVTHDIQEAIYLADRIIFFTRQPGRIKADLQMDFKNGRRFLKKEDLLAEPGYLDMEKQLYSMMREEIKGQTS
ncbi:ABC transporter ATP-binding protein [Sneathiella litorea]|uniref:ATP-binding cassette domain-containing protein n=1 Tax=Sneathiella litorea TaxID=2606216 RepID=A0A6L8W576_9PROT|nr:ABC transporter ATP-binding protein [Sneathiella litorea]MZR29633.1 ATP-binding cassette domain-containing protein [Sneathiella litorea]